MDSGGTLDDFFHLIYIVSEPSMLLYCVIFEFNWMHTQKEVCFLLFVQCFVTFVYFVIELILIFPCSLCVIGICGLNYK